MAGPWLPRARSEHLWASSRPGNLAGGCIDPTAHLRGMKVAKAKGRLPGKQPKLKPNEAKHLLGLPDSRNYSQAELGELFGVG